MADRRLVFEHIMEPGTGKAVPVLRGQILRIEQAGDGQCADFNAFNLHDYKEYFHCGRTRHMHGLWPKAGDMLWSAPPRERPMYTIVADPVGTNDVNYPRCTAFLYEFHYGYTMHTNCHDIQAEAQREYGLTPDDVHDSFNFWMHTGVTEKGRLYIKQLRARKGDYVELIAHIDTLAVGAAVALLCLMWLLPEKSQYKNQRSPKDFKIKEIKATRELARDAGYRPEWPVYPIVKKAIACEFSAGDRQFLDRLRDLGAFGETDGEIVRYAFFSWWIENKMHGPKHFDVR